MKSRLLLLLLLLISSCSVKKKELSPIESVFTIDLDGKKETSILLSTYFRNVKTLILETGKGCMIGLTSKLQVSDKYIFILDATIAKSLFVFDREGHFIRKIGSLGNGPGEYIQLTDFSLDTGGQFIYLLDYGQRVHKYRFDGTYVKTITPKLQNTNINYIQYYKNKLYLSVRSFQPALDDNLLLETDPDKGTILSRFLTVNDNKGWSELYFMGGQSFFTSRSNDPPIYSQLFMDYIITVGKEITPYIVIKSKNLATEEDIRKLSEILHTDRTSMALQNLSKIWNVHNIIENDDLIIFRYQHGFQVYTTAIFLKKTKEVKLVNYLSNDLIFRNDESGFYGKFAFSDTKGAYEVLHPIMIGSFQKSIRNNEVVPDLDKLDELLQLDEESNPVIFYYEFK